MPTPETRRILIAATDDILRNILIRFVSPMDVTSVACGSASEALGYLAAGHEYNLILAEPQLARMVQARHPAAVVLDVDVPFNLEELGRRVRLLIGDTAPPEGNSLTRPANAAALTGSVGVAGFMASLFG